MTDEQLKIIRRHQVEPPVNVVGIALDLGVEVFEDDKLPDHISGLLTHDDDGYFIIVNASHHPNRKRFTVAHEIAHFIRHRHAIGDGIQDNALYRSHLSSRQETEANRLAADILMPWELISNLVESVPDPTVAFLASELKVSKSAMSIRLGVPLEDE